VLARRLLLFAAVLLLLATAAAALAPRPPVADAPPSALPAADGEAGTIERTISADPGVRTAVTLRKGEILQLEVSGDLLDSVQLVGLDRIDGVEPLTPARFQVLGERPGVYPIRLLEADRQIGRLEITE
jgi:hypothetical protein